MDTVKEQEKDLKKEIKRVLAEIAERAEKKVCSDYGDIGDLSYILTELEQI